MRNILFFIFLASLFSCKPAINQENRIEEDVTFLASDTLEGRQTGTKGEKEAANYIGVSTKQLYRYRLNGKLKEYRNPNNGCLRFRKVDLDNFLNGKQNGSR